MSVYLENNILVDKVCGTPKDDCHEHATCTDLEPGKYECKCNLGYSGDGKTCIGVLVIISPRKYIFVHISNKFCRETTFYGFLDTCSYSLIQSLSYFYKNTRCLYSYKLIQLLLLIFTHH